MLKSKVQNMHFELFTVKSWRCQKEKEEYDNNIDFITNENEKEK